MKRCLIHLTLIVMLIGGLGVSFLHAEQEIQGTWVGSTLVPDMGEVGLTLVIEKIDGVYSGTISDSTGTLNNTELSDLDFTNSELSFNFLFDNGYSATTVDMILKAEGNKLTGYWQAAGDSAAVELEKKS